MMVRASVKACGMALVFFARVPFLACSLAPKPPLEAQESASSTAPLHGVLSRETLKPPIRGRWARLEFSPDGKYLLLQSEPGLFLFSTKPLKPVLHIDADYLYPVHFSRDSQTLSGVSLALRTAHWRIPSGETASIGELHVNDGCVSGDVSPDGGSFLCRDVNLDLHAFDLTTRSEIFRAEPRPWLPQAVTVPLALPRNNVYPAALGFVSVRSLQIFANEGMYPDRFAFSPDGTVFAISGPQEISLWSLLSKHKISVPGALTKYPGAGVCFLDANRMLITGVPQHAEIVSLTTGKVEGKVDFDISAAALASNPRYLMFMDSDSSSKQLYDLEERQRLQVADNVAIDVREDTLAALDATGQLQLFRLGEPAPFASTKAPLDGSPARFSAATSPDLDLLAFGFGQETALYTVRTGQQILSAGYSAQVCIPDSKVAYFVRPAEGRKAIDIVRADAMNASVVSPWRAEADFIRSTPSVLIEYELQGPKQHVPEVLPDGKIPFRLAAAEPGSGQVLWEKEFITAHPVPFVDTQGKNLVLAWDASTPEARAAAKRCPQAWPWFQKVKPSRNDTFFEVLSAATGQTIGGVLVRTGSGPLSFDSVAAVGPRLMVAKAEGRVTLYSLDDGDVKGRVNGSLPAANERTHLLALVENETHLGIYDLRNGKKLTVESIGQPITYTHFSEDGQRLLVLVRQQIVYVLDLSDAVKMAN